MKTGGSVICCGDGSKMNPHKTRREKLPAAAKGIGPMGMNKTSGSKMKKKKKSY